MVGRHFLINQHCFNGAANAGPAHFRIQHDIASHDRVRRRTDIDVANAVEMGDYQDPAFRLDTLDQAFAAARCNIEQVIHGQQPADCRPITGWDQLHSGFRQTGRFQALMQAPNGTLEE